MRIHFWIFCFFVSLSLFSQAQINPPRQPLPGEGKRPLSKSEITFLSSKVDSVKRNLNRMIRYEKELLQRNYYLNEKTALVDELIATIQYLQRSVDIAIISEADIKKIFGKSKSRLPGRMVYDIETYQSNCPFMEITFFMSAQVVEKVDYRITDCQKWK